MCNTCKHVENHGTGPFLVLSFLFFLAVEIFGALRGHNQSCHKWVW